MISITFQQKLERIKSTDIGSLNNHLQEDFNWLIFHIERLNAGMKSIAKGCPTKAKGCKCLQNRAQFEIELPVFDGSIAGKFHT